MKIQLNNARPDELIHRKSCLNQFLSPEEKKERAIGGRIPIQTKNCSSVRVSEFSSAVGSPSRKVCGHSVLSVGVNKCIECKVAGLVSEEETETWRV